RCNYDLFFLLYYELFVFFFFSSRRRHTRSKRDWSSDVCSSDLACKGFDSKPRRKMFVSTISDGGAWYELSVTFGVSGGTKTIHFRDSLKLLPFSVESIAKSL